MVDVELFGSVAEPAIRGRSYISAGSAGGKLNGEVS